MHIANGQGLVYENADGVTSVAVTCQAAANALLSFNIGVNVSGLSAGNPVTFVVGGANPLTVDANGLVVFPQTFYAETVYPPGATDVLVRTNPSGQTCTLAHQANVGAGFTNFVSYTAVCK